MKRLGATMSTPPARDPELVTLAGQLTDEVLEDLGPELPENLRTLMAVMLETELLFDESQQAFLEEEHRRRKEQLASGTVVRTPATALKAVASGEKK